MITYSRVNDLPSGQASNTVTPGCLLLEGGAFRGLFTSGVTDLFLCNDINMETTVGVSAGAMNGSTYVTGSIGRSARINLTHRRNPEYVSLANYFKHKSLINFDFVFSEQMKKDLPYDETQFDRTDRHFYVVTTNCLTGKTEYFEKSCGFLLKAVQASASMPLVSDMVMLNGQPYLDGGCSDRVPLNWVLKQRFRKIIVVRTTPKGFRREIKPLGRLTRNVYRKYPEFCKAMERSAARYNRTCDLMDRLEEEGRILSFYPSGDIMVSRLEKDMEKLGALYWEGYHTAEERLEEVKDYLEIK